MVRPQAEQQFQVMGAKAFPGRSTPVLVRELRQQIAGVQPVRLRPVGGGLVQSPARLEPGSFLEVLVELLKVALTPARPVEDVIAVPRHDQTIREALAGWQ